MHDDAAANKRLAICVQKSASHDLGVAWMAAMREGDFAAAWLISDEVLRRHLHRGEEVWRWPRHLQPVWNGKPLGGNRVLVRCYHGLGDTLQFLRFARPLHEIARHVAVWVQPSLMTLAASVPGVDTVLPLHDGTPEVIYDVDMEIMELPHALRVTSDTIQVSVPYVFPRGSVGWGMCGHRVGSTTRRRNVGIAWRAGAWDTRRSLPSNVLGALAEIRGVNMLSLQLDARPGELDLLQAQDARTENIEELGARIMALDLVISVDTLVAHLAGALGVPVWTLLHANCDWRWMSGRDDSPWYPTMRLFRQQRPGDWQSVLAKVTAALADIDK